MYDIIWQIYHTWCFHCCMYHIYGRRYKKYSYVLLCDQKISYTDVSEITSQVIWSLKWAFWLDINILLCFPCGRKGSQLVFHVTSQHMYANPCNRKLWHVPKNHSEQRSCHWKFHICIHMAAKSTFDTAVYC